MEGENLAINKQGSEVARLCACADFPKLKPVYRIQ